MAYGDVGGAVTELVLTCRTPGTGTVSIQKGDAVQLTEGYVVNVASAEEGAIFGQALAPASENNVAIPVKVRGVCIFGLDGLPPLINGVQGIVSSANPGQVKAPGSGNGVGINLKVDATTIHVLL